MSRSRRGQIVIPAMLIFPTLFLFVYLIYETAKLSRDKIKHQFAMDAAAFVEMTNYSDFLNRTAYVNGAFPMRIFEEGYFDFMTDCEGKTSTCASDKQSYAKILFKNGAFPYLNGDYEDGGTHPVMTIPGGSWPIEYGGAGVFKNVAWPAPDQPNGGAAAPDGGPYELFTLDNSNKFWHTFDLATEIYKLYVQIYSLLGSVEDAQFSVLKRLETGHTFMQKSYWLNTGDPIGAATQLATNFDNGLGNFNGAFQPYCQVYLNYWGNKHLNGGIQPYVPEKTSDTPGVQLMTSAGCPQGLFQTMYMNPNMLATIGVVKGGGAAVRGIPLYMNWAVQPNNYWNVNFVTMLAQQFPQGSLHTTISVEGDPASSPSVWPDPTPKFQVRQFP